MLTQNLSAFFSAGSREKGREYFASGNVKISEGNEWSVEAKVLGSQPYLVDLFRADGLIEAWCPCPDCVHHAESCEHIWAALLAAEAQGHLQGDRRQPVRDLILDNPFSNEFDDGDFDDDDDWPTYTRSFPPRRALPKAKHPSPPQRPPAQSWENTLSGLRASLQQTAEIAPAPLSSGEEIVYIVEVAATLTGGGLTVQVATRKRKKDGEWAKPKNRRFGPNEISRLPDPADRQALASLAGARQQRSNFYYGGNYYDDGVSLFTLTPGLWETLLPALCATGRCLLRKPNPDSPLQPVHWDDAGPWEFWLKVTPDDAAETYMVTGALRRAGEEMPLNVPHLLITGGLVFWDERVAPLRDFHAFPWIGLLRAKGEVAVPGKQKDDFLTEVLRLPKLPPLDLPEDLRYEEVRLAPRPYLKIKRRPEKQWMSKRDRDSLLAELSFEYGDHVVAARSPDQNIYEPKERRILLRDRDAELSLTGRLRELGVQHRGYYGYGSEESLELPMRHLPKLARALVQEGWRIEAEGKLYRQAGDFRIEVTSGIDWFEVHGGARFGDQEVPLPALLAALKRGEHLIPLGDGNFGMLPEEWLKKYGVLAQVGTTEEDHLRFNRTQVGLLDALLAEQPEVRFDQRFERARERLRRFQGIAPQDPPPAFEGALRGYQRDGLGWLHFLREFGFGGCLADDMGLGKTVQVLALLEARRTQRAARKKKGEPTPTLVVVPRSLVFNWKQEAARFTPKLRILDHTGLGRPKPGAHFDDYDVVLTTYGTLRRDIVEIKDYPFDYAILDEAQAIKNASSQSAKAARLIQSDYRLTLSGTPVENHLGELWSQFEFLNPGILGKTAELGLGDGSLRRPSEETQTLLSRALRPFILRRTKEQVAQDLPAKTEQTIYCDLETTQRKLYDELRAHYRESLLGRVAREGIKKSKIQILEALLRLRQAACHPGLINKEKYAHESSAKLDALLPQLREVFDEGHKTLVFSQFTSLLAIVRSRLDAEKVPYEYLDGRTRDRQARVNRFQDDPACKLFLISLKAGGLGLNLTAADYVFLLDPWWNPAVESQAIDRAHRIGQTRPVFAYRLIARDTVEEKVLELQAQKRALADAIITADNSLIGDLGREDLELLLS